MVKKMKVIDAIIVEMTRPLSFSFFFFYLIIGGQFWQILCQEILNTGDACMQFYYSEYNPFSSIHLSVEGYACACDTDTFAIFFFFFNLITFPRSLLWLYVRLSRKHGRKFRPIHDFCQRVFCLHAKDFLFRFLFVYPSSFLGLRIKASTIYIFFRSSLSSQLSYFFCNESTGTKHLQSIYSLRPSPVFC